MKGTWIKYSKLALLLVCFGFFMPVSCEMNGPDLAKLFNESGTRDYSIMIWVVFITVVLSIIITLINKTNVKKESLLLDWVLLGGSISGGLFSLGRVDRELFDLEIGAYIIISGWILSLIFLILASCSKRE